MNESSSTFNTVSGDMLKIATWNVNSLRVRMEHLTQWLATQKPDVLVLQETKTIDEQFPEKEIRALGYNVVYSGQKTYNGVAVLSLHEISDVVTDLPNLEDEQRRILAVTVKGIRILDLYVVNGSEVGSEKFAYKLDWLQKVTDWVKAEKAKHEDFVILGDFNIAPEDADVHNPKSWKDKILCSKEERTALSDLCDIGFVDSYRLFEQKDQSFSWWDYRGGGFNKNMGLRIDLILSSKNLARQCVNCFIDSDPRGWERPSDHAPVVAEYRNVD